MDAASKHPHAESGNYDIQLITYVFPVTSGESELVVPQCASNVKTCVSDLGLPRR